MQLVEEIVGRLAKTARPELRVDVPALAEQHERDARAHILRWRFFDVQHRSHWCGGEVGGGGEEPSTKSSEWHVSPEEVVEAEQVRVVMVPLGESRLELLGADVGKFRHREVHRQKG